MIILYFIYSMLAKKTSPKNEESILDTQATNNSLLKKEITKQNQLDISQQKIIDKNIATLKTKTLELARGLQQQKHKHLQLQRLIAHFEHDSIESKLNESSISNQGNSTEESLDHSLKKMKDELYQMICKNNKVEEMVEQKKLKIKQNRTQRVIDSGIFKNLEKELAKAERAFKQLLIERTKHQKIYEKLSIQYEGLRQESEEQKQQQNKIATKKTISQREQSSHIMKDITVIQKNHKFKEIKSVKVSHHSNHKTSKFSVNHEDYILENHILVIKKLLLQTGLKDPSELLQNLTHINEFNEKMFESIETTANQMAMLGDQLKQMEKTKKQLKKKYISQSKDNDPQKKIREKQTLLRESIKEIQRLNNQENKSIHHLTEQVTFKELTKNISNLNVNNSQTSENQVQHMLKYIQKRFDCKRNFQPSKLQLEKKNSNGSEKLEQMIKSAVNTECFGQVMKREQFQTEYHQLLRQTLKKRKSSKVIPIGCQLKIKK